jgi:hypothetical protein
MLVFMCCSAGFYKLDAASFLVDEALLLFRLMLLLVFSFKLCIFCTSLLC